MKKVNKKGVFLGLFATCIIVVSIVNLHLNSQNELASITLANLEALSQIEEVHENPIVFCEIGSNATHWGHCVGSTQTFGFSCIIEGSKDCHGTYLAWLG
jgi:hypothetical protein